MGRHVMEALGMTKVVMEDGKVIEVGEPKVKYCPLFHKHRGIEELNKESISKNMQYRMDSFGMCSMNRETKLEYFLSFGISELMSLSLSNGDIDAVVMVADGCGTCIITDSTIVQGMGGRISAIIETSPIPKVIEAIGEDNVLDPIKTPIDMVAGVKLAFSKGYTKIAVTVASADDAETIRKQYGDSVIIFAVHTTGVSLENAERLYKYCDVITACASKHIRDLSEKYATIQAGVSVPVYGASDVGKKIIEAKLKELNRTPDTELVSEPYPLL